MYVSVLYRFLVFYIIICFVKSPFIGSQSQDKYFDWPQRTNHLASDIDIWIWIVRSCFCIISMKTSCGLNCVLIFVFQFKCCGVGHKGYRDWSLNPYFNCNETNYGSEKCAVPYSCCIQPNNIDVSYLYGQTSLIQTPWFPRTMDKWNLDY